MEPETSLESPNFFIDAASRDAIETARAAILWTLRERRHTMEQVQRLNEMGGGVARGTTALDLYRIIEAAAWTLVRDGIIVPGRYNVADGGHQESGFPYFRVTPLGRMLLEKDQSDPYDYEGYLSDARSRLIGADERIFIYLAAATKNFRDNHVLNALSGLIMLGVSAELLMKWIIDRFIAHVPEHKRDGFEKTRSDLWMRTDKLFTAFISSFEAHYSEMKADLKYQAEANLDLLQRLIRINRDDVGHGRLQRGDQTMLHGNLLNYLTLLSIANELADAFKQPCTFYDK